MGPIELAIIWIALSLVAVYIATRKGNSGIVIFFVSILLSPLIGILIAIVQSPAKVPQPPPAPPAPASAIGVADELAKLSSLRDGGQITQGEFDRQRAILLPPAPAAPVWGDLSQATAGMACGFCGRPLSPAWVGKCKHCGTRYAEATPVVRPTP